MVELAALNKNKIDFDHKHILKYDVIMILQYEFTYWLLLPQYRVRNDSDSSLEK